MVASAALWGGSTVLTKGTLELVAPFTLLVLQLLASVAALALALALRGRLRLRAAAWRGGWIGLLEPGLAYGLGVPGILLTTAGAASLIAATEPAFVILVAWAALGQRPSARLSGAIVVAMAGVALVTLSDEGGGGRSLAGDGLVLAGTAAASLYVVLSSRLTGDVAPLALALAQHAWGLGLALVLWAAAVALGRDPAALPEGRALGLALLSGVLQYALPFWLYLRAVSVLPVGQAALVLTLSPVFGVAGGMMFLGESLAWSQAAGAVLILAAVAGVARTAD